MKLKYFSKERLLVSAFVCLASAIYLMLVFIQRDSAIRRDIKRRSDVLALQQSYIKMEEEGKLTKLQCNEFNRYFGGDLPLDPLGYPKHSDYQIYCDEGYYCICALMENPGTGNNENGICSAGEGENNNWFCIDINNILIAMD